MKTFVAVVLFTMSSVVGIPSRRGPIRGNPSLSFAQGRGPYVASNRTRRNRALIVAIDDYAHEGVPDLKGCSDDAELILSLLIRQCGFGEKDIRVLKNQQATRAEILRQVREWLISCTRAGDRVFFHYSGYGAWVPDENRDEKDGLDEAIAPHDVNPITRENLILDDEFESFVSQLTGRKAIFVFDSCFSGTILGGPPLALDEFRSGGIRYLPSPWEIGKRKTSTRGVERPSKQGHSIGDDGIIDKRQMGLLSGVIVVSAAATNQLAYTISMGDQVFGALTYALVEEQRRGTRILSELKQSTYERFLDWGRRGLIAGTQRPDFEVSDEQLGGYPMFSDDDQFAEETISVALTNKLSSRTVTLRPRDSSGRNRTEFRLGEEVFYDVVVDQPGYFYLIVFSRQGKASVIFPFTEATDRKQVNSANYLTTGRHRLPRGTAGYPVQEPLGKDVVVGLIAGAPLDLGHKVYFDSWLDVIDRIPVKGLEEEVARMRDQSNPQIRKGSTDWKAAIIVMNAAE